MFITVKYFGFYPLGSDIRINGVEIMKSKWHQFKKVVFMFGRTNNINPMGLPLFYVVSNNNIVFFSAFEEGLGHYHIFTVGEKQSKKLSKRINNNDTYDPIAVQINKVACSVRVYGRVVSGARDINYTVDDAFFRLIDTLIKVDFIRYTFTNNGEDRLYLDVYNPMSIDESELYIKIQKADRIIWHWVSLDGNENFREYRLLDSYVELKEMCNGENKILYFH